MQGDQVIAKVRAYNEIGWSDFSYLSSSDVLVVAKPYTPSSQPIRDSNLSTLEQVHLLLPSIEGIVTGGLPITSYSVESSYDQLSWSVLSGVYNDY